LTRKSLALLIVLSTCLPPIALWWQAQAQTSGAARLEGLRFALEGKQLMVGWNTLDVFDQDFERRLESGLPTALSFELELVQLRRSWFDRTLETSQVQVIAMYNALTREYLVNLKLDGTLISSRILREREDLRLAMSHFDALPAFDLGNPAPEGRLRFRVRAELGTKPVLFFIPRTLHTDWLESRFFRVAELVQAPKAD
jgi:hypothetical protein